MTIESLLAVGALLIISSIAFTRLSSNLGVPTLVLFLAIGMFAGSEGPGGIYFNDPPLAQSIGIIALVFILFAGGLDTKWRIVKPVVWSAVSLSTLGIMITTLLVGLCCSYLLNVSILYGVLIGAIISSTDAAAVFSVLRSRKTGLPVKIQSLLELESGSNDPMAVLITISVIQLLNNSDQTIGPMILMLFTQLIVGAISGLLFGKGMVFFLNRLKVEYQGMYPVASLAFALFCYGGTTLAGGSGFLSVYIAGMVAAHGDFVHKKSLLRFFDGLAWLSQIAMFLTLGLLVFPSRLVPVITMGVFVSAFLMFVARPVSVFLGLQFSQFQWREKAFISWVGLRGAAPIVLATFPLLYHVPGAELIFNLVFFIVLTSALLQGWSIPFAAKILKIKIEQEGKPQSSFDVPLLEGGEADLVDFIVPPTSEVIGRPIVELGMPEDCTIVLISRNDALLAPSGSSELQGGDTILVIIKKEDISRMREILTKKNR